MCLRQDEASVLLPNPAAPQGTEVGKGTTNGGTIVFPQLVVLTVGFCMQLACSIFSKE